MPSCMVKTCKNGYKGHNTPKCIRWFHLPTSQSLRDRWFFQINREDENNFSTKHAQICSEHFRPDDFLSEEQNRDNQGRKRKIRNLKPNVVPTINMPQPLLPDQISDKPSTGKISKKRRLVAKNQLPNGRLCMHGVFKFHKKSYGHLTPVFT